MKKEEGFDDNANVYVNYWLPRCIKQFYFYWSIYKQSNCDSLSFSYYEDNEKDSSLRFSTFRMTFPLSLQSHCHSEGGTTEESPPYFKVILTSKIIGPQEIFQKHTVVATKTPESFVKTS